MIIEIVNSCSDATDGAKGAGEEAAVTISEYGHVVLSLGKRLSIYCQQLPVPFVAGLWPTSTFFWCKCMRALCGRVVLFVVADKERAFIHKNSEQLQHASGDPTFRPELLLESAVLRRNAWRSTPAKSYCCYCKTGQTAPSYSLCACCDRRAQRIPYF